MTEVDLGWLKAELAKPGRSQADLARYLGLHASAVNRLVNGTRPLRANHLHAIEAYLSRVPERNAAQDRATTLAKRVLERLQDLGLSYLGASRMAGLRADFVRDIVRGKVKQPSAARLEALARALKCQTRYLLGYSDQPGEVINGAGSEAFDQVLRIDALGEGTALLEIKLRLSQSDAMRIFAFVNDVILKT